MSLSTQPYKGARDFYPENERVQKYMFNVIRGAVERFGYEEYDAPILEPIDIYLAKSGEEIVNDQTYVFEDRGGRKVVIRPEMTPTVSRMVAARRQELAYPLRWYSIPNLWRYERPQRGRLREHWQLNVDIFGLNQLAAEMEIIMVVDAILRTLGAQRSMYTIKLNSRKLMDTIMRDYLGLDDDQSYALSKLIDRMHKIDRAHFIADADRIMTPQQRESGNIKKLTGVLNTTSISDLPQDLLNHHSVLELQKLITRLELDGINNTVFDITLMRGFDYYTDIVFEVFDNSPENKNRSMFGGGRYDGLVGLFGVEPVPTVGFGMGDVMLVNFLETHKLLPRLVTETDIYAILIGDVANDAQRYIGDLRSKGLNVAVDYSERKPDKQIKTAIKKGIPFTLFIGDNELKEGKFTLRNLAESNEETGDMEHIVRTVMNYRASDSD